MGASEADHNNPMSHHAVGDTKNYWEIEDRTSISISLRDQPGCLQNALLAFTQNSINLTRIQSRPAKMSSKNEKIVDFYADFEGRIGESNVDKAISELKKLA